MKIFLSKKVLSASRWYSFPQLPLSIAIRKICSYFILEKASGYPVSTEIYRFRSKFKNSLLNSKSVKTESHLKFLLSDSLPQRQIETIFHKQSPFPVVLKGWRIDEKDLYKSFSVEISSSWVKRVLVNFFVCNVVLICLIAVRCSSKNIFILSSLRRSLNSIFLKAFTIIFKLLK